MHLPGSYRLGVADARSQAELMYTQHFEHMLLERQIDWSWVERIITEPNKVEEPDHENCHSCIADSIPAVWRCSVHQADLVIRIDHGERLDVSPDRSVHWANEDFNGSVAHPEPDPAR